MKKAVLLTCFIIIMLTDGLLWAGSRAIWVVRDELKDSESVEQIIKTAIQLNISDIYLQVRALGKVYYPSELEPVADGISINFNPLALAITQAHLHNIKIHAWLNVFYIWRGDIIPAEENHCFNKYKNFIMRKDRFPVYNELRRAGIEGFFLDPGVTEVKQYIISLINELIINYRLDGIHLDYFRYPGISYSFTPRSRTQFMLINYFDPYILYSLTDDYVRDRGYEAYLHADEIYRNFLINNLTLFMQEISESIKLIKPEINLSVAVKPDPIQAKHRFFQDWPEWLVKNHCDFLVLMNYHTDLTEFTRILSKVKEHADINRIIVGISTFNQNEQAVNKRIEMVKAYNFAGFSLFSYNHLVKNRKYLLNLLL